MSDGFPFEVTPKSGSENQHAQAEGAAQQAVLHSGTQNVYFVASPDPQPEAAVADGRVLPSALTGLIRAVCQVTDDLPYPLPGYDRPSLSGVYVRQSVSAPLDLRPVWEEESDPDEVELIEQYRKASRLAQPFEEVLDQHDHLVLEGAAGLGKTTLGYQLVGSLARSLLDDPEPGDRGSLVPLVLPARVLATHLCPGWGATVQAAIAAEYGGISDGEVAEEIFGGTVGGRRWLIVVDALDEIPDQTARERLLTKLAAHMAQPRPPVRFVITTRPLPPGEIARLRRGPQVGFFELLPFDRDALIRFAQRWFNAQDTPEGALATEGFLEQVQASGLSGIVEVPLLASVAASVYATRRDRLLPASRFELYENYISMYAQARAEANTGKDERERSREESALLDWLDQHRVEMLELLGTAYVSRETPLLEVVRQRLDSEAEDAPAPIGTFWESTVIDWLSRTGLVVLRGGRPRFLHQTFAEHLAASAGAKALPETFLPEQEPWEGLIRGLLLGDEGAERTVVHHLHLTASRNGLLAWLQRATYSHRERAVALVAQGVPCDDQRLGVHLDFIAHRLSTDYAEDLASLASLVRRPQVQDRLRALLEDDLVRAEAKIKIIEILGARSPQIWPRSTELLGGYTGTEHPSALRLAAARVLAKLGRRHLHTATCVFRDLAGDESRADQERLEAAELLAKLGPEHRAESVATLRQLTDTSNPLRKKWTAVTLARLGDEHRERAAEILGELAVDTALPEWQRRDAAEELAKLGREHRETAVAALRASADDPFLDAADRALALTAIAWIAPETWEDAVEALITVACGTQQRPHQRFRAVESLAQLGGEQRSGLAAMLSDIVADPQSDTFDHFAVAKQFLVLGPEWRPRAAEVFRLAAEVPNESFRDKRINAAMELAKLGDENRHRAAAALHGMMTDRTIEPDDRVKAAQTLAGLGEVYVQQVREHCEELLNHPFASPEDNVLALSVLHSLSPDNQAVLATAIKGVVGRANVDGTSRILGGGVLRKLGGLHTDRGGRLLAEACEDSTLTPQERFTSADLLLESAAAPRTPAVSALLRMSQDPTFKPNDRLVSLRRLADHDCLPPSEIFDGALATLKAQQSDINYILVTLESLGSRRSDLHDRYLACVRDLTRDQTRTYQDRLAGVVRLAASQTPDTESLSLVTWMAGARGQGMGRIHAAKLLYTLGGEHGANAVRFLDLLAGDKMEDTSIRSRALLALARIHPDRRSDIANHLLELLEQDAREQHLNFPQNLFEALAQLNLTANPRVAAALSLISEDLKVFPERRIDATMALARLGGTYREAAVMTLQAVANDESVAPSARCRAAAELAFWTGTDRQNAIAALTSLATDQRRCGEHRVRAAKELRKLGTGPAESASDALIKLVTESDVDLWERIGATDTLVVMGPRARHEAGKALIQMDSASCSPLQFALTRVRLAALDSRYVAEAYERLTSAAADADLRAWERQCAVAGLLQLSHHHLERAAELLTNLAQDDGHTLWERRQACEALACLGPGHRRLAVTMLAEPSTPGEGTRVWEISEAASALAELDAGHTGEAHALILSLGEDRTHSFNERIHALELLVESGSPTTATALELLLQIVAEPDADAEERISTLIRLTQRERSRVRALDLLRDISHDQEVPNLARLWAAMILSGSDPGLREPALSSLGEFVQDSAHSIYERALAAGLLTEEGREQHRLALSVLDAFTQDLRARPIERAYAEHILAHYDQSRWYIADAEMVRAADTTTDPDDLRGLLAAMAQFDQRHLWASMCGLRELVVDHSAAPGVNLRAASDIADLLDSGNRVNRFAPPCGDFR
ncbi:NACHT domain-containing protein [Nocardiopsis deserti]|uniref:NACHT domain-containing protein n=1 Tax=Nocardiopsis deserti TaxID=2605988 RepID=UPI00123B1855|nr:NACHT domain-containing protein [Nocardiopsis deserti]